MKLATYRQAGRVSFGTVQGEAILDIPRLLPDGPATLLEALQAGPGALRRIESAVAKGGPRVAMREVELLAPLPAPPKVIGIAVNYAEHHREWERGAALPEDPSRTTTPRPFLMPTTAVTGPDTEIPWPAYSEQIDYEVELAVVIGAPAQCISPAEAAQFIAGYTIANDISARSVTFADGRAERPKDEFYDWLAGKWADGFCPMGPVLVTAEEIADPMNLAIELSVNGQARQSANTSQMIFDIYELVSFLSHLMTLTPGDVIATGTPSGVAKASGRYLAAGDVITCRIEGIGELTNTLGRRPGQFYRPCRR
jgi:2-keto-4-pentenoate hydratase/2-oxohepta-3-ene-1,7-dioic acid hydratase in catechol pathway